MGSQYTLLVPVVNAAGSLDAVVAASQIAKTRRGKVIVVHVIEVSRSLPLNENMQADARRGDQLLRKAEEVAHHAGHSATGELLQAREAGQAIVDEVRDREVDAIVMGIPYHQEYGVFRLGATADFVLKHAPCEVWLIRQGTMPLHNHLENHEVQRK